MSQERESGLEIRGDGLASSAPVADHPDWEVDRSGKERKLAEGAECDKCHAFTMASSLDHPVDVYAEPECHEHDNQDIQHECKECQADEEGLAEPGVIGEDIQFWAPRLLLRRGRRHLMG